MESEFYFTQKIYPEADSINRFNDAEQTMMREANDIGAEIISIGATRDMCPACQAVAKENRIIDRVSTSLKKIKKENKIWMNYIDKKY